MNRDDTKGSGDELERRRNLKSSPARYGPALIAAIIGLVLSLVGGYAVGRWEENVTKTEFDSVAETQAIVLQNGINEYLSRLATLRTLFESANSEITRSEFEVFSRRLFENHPGSLRVGWVPRVNRKERAEYEAAAVTDGIVAYNIKSLTQDGGLMQAPESNEYFPVFYSTEPKTSVVYGIDYLSDPARRTTLERARDNDIVTVLPAKVWYHLKSGGRAVSVCVPVYVKGASRTTVADRRRNLAGFIVGIFELPQLLQSILSTNSASKAVYASVYPPGTEYYAAAKNFTPDFSTAPDADRSIKTISAQRYWSGILSIGDSRWPILTTPATNSRLSSQYSRAAITTIAGLTISGFVVIYLSLVSRNARQLAVVNQRVLDLAQIDILTGLPNRASFLKKLEQFETQLLQRGDEFSVFMLDLDRFKNVNDSLGHAAGDILLRDLAVRLRTALRKTDVLARLGGDEFAIIQTACDDQTAGAIDLAKRISALIAEPFMLPNHRVEVGTSIGIAMAPKHGNDPHELLKKSDLALYRSKSAGRNCFTVYDDAMSAELEARDLLEGDLRDAITRGEFEVYYQPIFEIETGQRRGFEALVRWRHPIRGLISPDQFIPLAEETGLILALGEWVLWRACNDATSWPDNIKVAVNLSPVQFKQADLFDVILSVLQNSRLPPSRLVIEVTESVLLERGVENHAFMQKLKNLGVSLALDDFGTGYSSLSYLTTFPFDRIKIDKSFISGLTIRNESSAIVSSIVTLAHGLDMSVTAEGVETREQFEMLRLLGVKFAQGYLLGRPVPLNDIDSQRKLYIAQKNAA